MKKAKKPKKPKKPKKVRNNATAWIAGYVEANRQSSIENERRREEEGFVEQKGLKNLSSTEKTYVIIIALGLIGIFIKYVVLRMF